MDWCLDIGDRYIDVPIQQKITNQLPISKHRSTYHWCSRKIMWLLSLLSNQATTTIRDYCTVILGYQARHSNLENWWSSDTYSVTIWAESSTVSGSRFWPLRIAGRVAQRSPRSSSHDYKQTVQWAVRAVQILLPLSYKFPVVVVPASVKQCVINSQPYTCTQCLEWTGCVCALYYEDCYLLYTFTKSMQTLPSFSVWPVI